MKKLKLNQIEKDILNKNEMNHLVGGCRVCVCACHGPSSSSDNRSANYGIGPGGGYSDVEGAKEAQEALKDQFCTCG